MKKSWDLSQLRGNTRDLSCLITVHGLLRGPTGVLYITMRNWRSIQSKEAIFLTQLNSGGTGQCGPQHNATSLSISTGLCVSEPTTHVSEPTTHHSSTHYPLPMLVKPLPTIHVSEPMSLDVIV